MKILWLVMAAGIVSAMAQSGDPEKAVLRPRDGVWIAGGKSQFIAHAVSGATLTVDGKAVELMKRGASGVSAELALAEGVHSLVYGTETVRFAVGKAEGFREFREHPQGAGCDRCHEGPAAKPWEMKNGNTKDNCLECHKSDDTFEKPHSHVPEVLKDCGWCHLTHGSAEKSHLKLPKEKACKLCHNS